MLISSNFIWLHLPKTGGTSTARLFRELNRPGISIDPDHVDTKHQSIQDRLENLLRKKTEVLSRRLTSWLLNYFFIKLKKMGLTPIRSCQKRIVLFIAARWHLGGC